MNFLSGISEMFYCVDKRVFVSFFKIMLLRQFIQQYKSNLIETESENAPCTRNTSFEIFVA